MQRTFDAADESTLMVRCHCCGRVKLLRELPLAQRQRLERGLNIVRCAACPDGRGKPLPGYVGGCSAYSTTAEAFPVDPPTA